MPERTHRVGTRPAVKNAPARWPRVRLWRTSGNASQMLRPRFGRTDDRAEVRGGGGCETGHHTGILFSPGHADLIAESSHHPPRQGVAITGLGRSPGRMMRQLTLAVARSEEGRFASGRVDMDRTTQVVENHRICKQGYLGDLGDGVAARSAEARRNLSARPAPSSGFGVISPRNAAG